MGIGNSMHIQRKTLRTTVRWVKWIGMAYSMYMMTPRLHMSHELSYLSGPSTSGAASNTKRGQSSYKGWCFKDYNEVGNISGSGPGSSSRPNSTRWGCQARINRRWEGKEVRLVINAHCSHTVQIRIRVHRSYSYVLILVYSNTYCTHTHTDIVRRVTRRL